jgi:hypothetical protein
VRRPSAPTPAALIINEFLLSKEAGIIVTDVTLDALKKAKKKYFSQVDMDIMQREGHIYLINKSLVETND